MPSGFATASDTPLVPQSATSLGCTTNPAIASAVASRASAANGSQRGDGSVLGGTAA